MVKAIMAAIIQRTKAMMETKTVAPSDSHAAATSTVAHVSKAKTKTVQSTTLRVMKMDRNQNLAETDASIVNDQMEVKIRYDNSFRYRFRFSQ